MLKFLRRLFLGPEPEEVQVENTEQVAEPVTPTVQRKPRPKTAKSDTKVPGQKPGRKKTN